MQTPSVFVLAFLLHQVVGDASTDLVSKAGNVFANKLYKQIISGNPGNQLVCPISLHVALALVHEGAGGKTAEQIATTIGFSGTSSANNDIKQGYRSILSNLNDDSLQIATKLFPAQGYQLNDNYLQVARDYFYSDVEVVDYNDATTAANKINKYVEDKTKNKIHDLITPDSLSGDTKLVLINAVHFEGKWKQPFSSAYEGNFRVTPQQQVKTRLMNQNGDFLYKEDPTLDAKVLKMDYQAGNYSMIFILPNKEATGLSELEEKLSGMTLPDILKDMSIANVEVTIPKFTLEQTIELKDTLAKMGITDMFQNNADLHKITTGNGDNLYVSKVVQKTFINVHEEGTEAAAATGFLETLSAIPDVNIFNAKRPFLFYLTHSQKPKQSKVLFQGRFAAPKVVKREEEKGNQVVGFNEKEGNGNNNRKNNQKPNVPDSEPVYFPSSEEDEHRNILPHQRYPTQPPASQYNHNFNENLNNQGLGNQNPQTNVPYRFNQYSPQTPPYYQTYDHSNTNQQQFDRFGGSQYSLSPETSSRLNYPYRSPQNYQRIRQGVGF